MPAVPGSQAGELGFQEQQQRLFYKLDKCWGLGSTQSLVVAAHLEEGMGDLARAWAFLAWAEAGSFPLIFPLLPTKGLRGPREVAALRTGSVASPLL